MANGSSVESNQMAKLHILIVEDDKSLADVLEYNLAQAGYEVSVARDGKDGCNRLKSKFLTWYCWI